MLGFIKGLDIACHELGTTELMFRIIQIPQNQQPLIFDVAFLPSFLLLLLLVLDWS